MAAILMSRFSYPKVPGDGYWSMADVSGPVSYTPVLPVTVPPPPPPPEEPPPADDEGDAVESAAANPTGGQMVTSADFGMQSLDWVGSMGSSDGAYVVSVVPGDFSQGSPLDWVLLLWIDPTTGIEVTSGTNLSSRIIRLLAIGR